MKISFNINLKVILGFIFGFAIVAATVYVKPTIAQSNSLSGMYGCVSNRNFGWISLPGGIGLSSNESINSLSYLDFTNNRMRSIISMVNPSSNQINTQKVIAPTIVSISAGPIPNSYVVSASVAANAIFNGSPAGVITTNVMSVNGGATLLTQAGVSGSFDGESNTGVCNKI